LIHHEGHSIAKASKVTNIPYDNAKAINRTYMREKRIHKINYRGGVPTATAKGSSKQHSSNKPNGKSLFKVSNKKAGGIVNSSPSSPIRKRSILSDNDELESNLDEEEDKYCYTEERVATRKVGAQLVAHPGNITSAGFP
jgi:hypothetical protein